MGRVCCPVASHLIGAVPFLLEHKSNGLVFESGNLDSLTENIEFLINHPDEMKRMSLKAYFTMKDTWNPCEVAKRLIRFFEEFLSGNVAFTFKDGPLSVATPISEKYSELI
jgi:glycosyltransferase involved in cell wall biosynthesis